MTTGTKKALAWFEGNYENSSYRYWAIYYKGKVESGNFICRSKTDDNLPFDESYSDLQKKMELLDRGSYTIIANDKPKVSERGGARYDFDISIADEALKHAVNPINQQPGIMGFDQVNEIATNKAKELLENFKLQQENEQLKKENAELKKIDRELEQASSRRWEMAIGMLKPFAESIMAGKLNTGQIAGMQPASEVPEASQQEELENICTTLEKHFPNGEWIALLKKLCVKLDNDPVSVKAIIKMSF